VNDLHSATSCENLVALFHKRVLMSRGVLEVKLCWHTFDLPSLLWIYVYCYLYRTTNV